MEDVCVVHGVGEWGKRSNIATAAPLVQAPLHGIENQANKMDNHNDDQRRFKEEDNDNDCLSNMAYIGIYDGHGGTYRCIFV
jgi:hypothetical protein